MSEHFAIFEGGPRLDELKAEMAFIKVNKLNKGCRRRDEKHCLHFCKEKKAKNTTRVQKVISYERFLAFDSQRPNKRTCILSFIWVYL